MTIVLQIEYDGTEYSGWQIQNNSRTIQREVLNAVKKILGEEVKMIGAGRTDSNVHAKQMTASFPFEEIKNITTEQMVKALNSFLPHDIRILKTYYLEKEFNARFDAIAREYSYHLKLRKSVFHRYYATDAYTSINKEVLFDSASIFLNNIDFTTFSKQNPSIKNNICNVTISEWEEVKTDYLVYHIKANHFLYGMVRSIVGVMFDIARGFKTKEEVQCALLQKNRELNSVLAPPQGLYFEKAYYDESWGIF